MDTSTNLKAKTISLEDISEGMKKLALLPDTREEDKILGVKAAALKFLQPEFYRKMSDEDKCLIDQSIERAAYINREEILEKSRIVEIELDSKECCEEYFSENEIIND